ncbi:hypothetical protein ACFLW7_02110 [Chloroflexota bacterium]
MTIHSNTEYKCKYCDYRFVPIPEAPNCPKCLRKSDTLFPDFVKNTIDSAQFNLSRYGMFIKMWATLDVGDFYYLWAFHFLNWVCSELNVDKYKLLSIRFSRARTDWLASRYLHQLQYKDPETYCRMYTLKPYLSLLLQRESE